MLKHRLFKPGGRLTRKKIKAKRKFLYFFPGGFQSEKYISEKRAIMWNAHEEWKRMLNRNTFKQLLAKERFWEIKERALNIESGTKLLFPLEKIALREALRTPGAAKIFASGLYENTYGRGTMRENFESFREALSKLPAQKKRVHTWPVQTLYGFIAHPTRHILLKPMATKSAAKKYEYDLIYKPIPNWETYESMLDFAATIRKDIPGLQPRDLMDLQVFITVLGSDAYPD
jgi:hypothetical protein